MKAEPMAPARSAARDVSLGFLPDPERGRAIDHAVRDRLATSLTAILEAAQGELPFDQDALAALVLSLRRQRVPPGVMAVYGELVTAIFKPDAARAARLLACLGDPHFRNEPTGLRGVTLDSSLDPLVAECYLRQFLDGGDLALILQPLPAAALAEATAVFEAGRALLGKAYPALEAEIAALVSEVIFVVPEGAAPEITLHGASTFLVWGALLLNPLPHPNRLKMAEVLVHESAHSLLHGFTMGLPLVENPDSERFPSPLRHDPRPMEGIVHASYVLARMHLGMSAMMARGGLDDAEVGETQISLARIRRNFADGHAVVRDHARFTALGATVFAGATAYMAEAA
jgi:HEXXH motif-containing protein